MQYSLNYCGTQFPGGFCQYFLLTISRSNFVLGAKTILEDDRVLESIEASFRQFHSFLDLLKGSKLVQFTF